MRSDGPWCRGNDLLLRVDQSRRKLERKDEPFGKHCPDILRVHGYYVVEAAHAQLILDEPGDRASVCRFDVRVRMLLVHQADGFRDQGVAIALSYNPRPASPLGFRRA